MEERLKGTFGIRYSKFFTHFSRRKPTVAILLPTYCEAENIESLIRELIQEVKNLNLESYIVVIDDSSPDETIEVVKKLQNEYNNIILYVRPAKLGLGSAITDGFRFILSWEKPPEYIVTMDADYSHDPKEIPKLISAVDDGCDLVIGSRYCEGGEIVGWSSIRWLISRFANFIASTMVRMKIRDCTSGMRCYSLQYVKNVIGDLHSQTYEIQIETVKQAWARGFRIKEVPITFVNRKRGKSKLTLTEIKSFLWYIIKTKLGIGKYTIPEPEVFKMPENVLVYLQNKWIKKVDVR